MENRGTWNRTSPKSGSKDAAPKIVGPIPPDLEGKKAYLENWVKENRIPGKIQSWFTQPSKAETSDWRIHSQMLSKTNRVLSIEGPYKGAKPPKIVLDIDAQIRKPHLSKFRKSVLQIWLRATGDGRYGLAVQTILHSAEATREFKTFMNYLKHEHSSDILCCHQIQIRPVQAFDPAHPSPDSQIELHKGFGNEFLPIAGTGQMFHIADWTPRAKEPWLALPKRIREAIHPSKEDKFLECHAGPAYIAEALSPYFSASYAVDQRNIPRQVPHVRMIRSTVEKDFFEKFFAGKGKEGKWTIYLDPPNGKSLGALVSKMAACRPERILLNSSNLSVATTEIKKFRNEGYMLRKIIPLDLEPGSNTFQTLFLFVPDRAGLLGRKTPHPGKVIKRIEKPATDMSNAAETIRFTQKRRK